MTRRPSIGLSVDNIEGVKNALMRKGADAHTAIARAVTASGFAIDRDIKIRFRRGPKTGTTYYRIPGDKYMVIRAGSDDGPPVAFVPGGGRRNLSPRHTASAPGESPATDTGMTVDSITFRQTTTMTVEIESRMEAAYWLEYGTQRMEPRPAWTPARDAEAPKFRARVVAALRGAL
jgi:hypothetical protein